MADGPRTPHSTLPALDASAEQEAGMILLGLEAPRLLAGLGLAVLADELVGDPALVPITVDRARHHDTETFTFTGLVHTGARRWRALRPLLDEVRLDRSTPGSVRETWAGVARHLARVSALGTAARIHVTACCIRRDEIDGAAAVVDGS